MVSGSLLSTRLAMWRGAKDQVANLFLEKNLMIHNFLACNLIEYVLLWGLENTLISVKCGALQHSYPLWEPLWMTITLLQVKLLYVKKRYFLNILHDQFVNLNLIKFNALVLHSLHWNSFTNSFKYFSGASENIKILEE